MKKTLLLFLLACCLSILKGFAQTPRKPADSIPVFSLSDSAAFTGKYKYENLPFDYMEVSVKEGKLVYAGGEYSGVLSPQKGKKDVFDANGGAAVFTFLRDSAQKVTDLQIDYQGQVFVGKREGK